MLTKALLCSAALICLAHPAPAQDPLTVAPQAYKSQFENDWVRVTRVHYAPHVQVAAHDHSHWPAAYVYLNDAGPIIFRHAGWGEHPDLTRPATKAGSFRLSPTLADGERHEVINPSDVPSDFLRVEFKTRPDAAKQLRGRFHREPHPAGENSARLHFENEQLRVTRLVCASGGCLNLTAGAGEPALIVLLSADNVRLSGPGGETERVAVEPGRTMWLAAGRREAVGNMGGGPVELLRFDLKTAPLKTVNKK